jgi:hypothetical protein
MPVCDSSTNPKQYQSADRRSTARKDHGPERITSQNGSRARKDHAMNELLPILGGFIAGMFAGIAPPRARFPMAILLGSMVAVAATLASGEYQIGWYYVLIDAVLAIAAALSMTALLGAMRFGYGQGGRIT